MTQTHYTDLSSILAGHLCGLLLLNTPLEAYNKEYPNRLLLVYTLSETAVRVLWVSSMLGDLQNIQYKAWARAEYLLGIFNPLFKLINAHLE